MNDDRSPNMLGATVLSFPASNHFTPEQALHSALQLDLADVVIVGFDRDGDLAVRSSRMSRQEALFLAEKLKQYALEAE